ncbi:serine/threonine protein kinase, putative (SRPK1), partial [Plasmodium malariae]
MSYTDSRSASNNSTSQDATSGKLQYTESDDEGSDEYCNGGYHPVKINEIYNERYRIEGKLGWGHFSTVWVATDLKSKPLKFVAIKIQKGSESYTESAKCEINYLKTVKVNSFDASWVELKEQQRERLFHYNMTKGVVSFIDSFEHNGPNGTHVCMVFEFMGPNLLSLIKYYDYKGIPLNLVRKIATHVLIGLQYLHDVCKIIHSDIKPENVLVSALTNIPKPKDYSKEKLINDNEKENESNHIANKEMDKNYFTTKKNMQNCASSNEQQKHEMQVQSYPNEEVEDDESYINDGKDQIELDNIEWSKLSKNEKKKLKKKKKKILKRERLKMEKEKKDKEGDKPITENIYINKQNIVTQRNSSQNDNNEFKKEDNENINVTTQLRQDSVSKKTLENYSEDVVSYNIVNTNCITNCGENDNFIESAVTKEVLNNNISALLSDNKNNIESNSNNNSNNNNNSN